MSVLRVVLVVLSCVAAAVLVSRLAGCSPSRPYGHVGVTIHAITTGSQP